jgi:cyclopropane-fatty-acyl-phospholipid synthase
MWRCIARSLTGGLKASFEKKDYRELIGNYNHIASIGMLEHVGMDYWNQYFRKIYELLNPGGRAMIQSIVYTANDYDDYIHSASFTKLYIFPGGFLPTPDCIKKSAIQAGLKVINTFDFGLDYAKTLSLWRDNFLKAVSKIDKLGFDDNFKRLWHYYLCVSEASFLTHQTSVMQIELIKPVCPEDAYL